MPLTVIDPTGIANTGSFTFGNVTTNIVTANTFSGDGSQLTNVTDTVARSTANAALAAANTGGTEAASAGSYANSAFLAANTADSKAVTSGSYANSAYGQANTATTNAATADEKAVSAGLYANAAFIQANTVFEYANTLSPQDNVARDTANSAALYANGAFTQSNAAYNQANTATTDASTADSKAVTSGSYANSAYNQANTATTNASTADEKAVSAGSYANSAYTQANTATSDATTADSKAVTAGSYANSAFGVANIADSKAITAGEYANSAFLTANTADSKAVTAGSYANSAFLHANAAYTRANNSIDANNGGTITGSLTIFGGDLSVTGNLIVTGNTITQNVQSLEIVDPLIYLASNNFTSDIVEIGFTGNYFDGSNVRHTGIFREASNKEYYIFDNYELEPDPNLIDINDPSFRVAALNANVKSQLITLNGQNLQTYVDGAYSKANLADAKATSAGSYANSAFAVANAASGFLPSYITSGTSNVYFSGANGSIIANVAGNTVFTITANGFTTVGASGDISGANNITANTIISSNAAIVAGINVVPYIQSSFNQANTANTNAVTAGSYANSAFGVANSAALYANGAFIQANAAFLKANTPDAIANSAAIYANAAFIQANAAFSVANVANTKEGVTTLTVTNSGSSSYLFDQYSGNNPSLYLHPGQTISFNLNVTGHPFMIRQSSGGAEYNTGLTHISTTGVVSQGSAAQGKESGTLIWKVPFDLVGTTYVYQCQIHSGMVGNLVVQNLIPVTLSLANNAYNHSNSAFIQANAAYTRANNSLNANTGGTVTGNVTVTGFTNLGNVGNVIITGGVANYVLRTDGSGNLSWVAQSGGGGDGTDNVARQTANAAFIQANAAYNQANTGGSSTDNVARETANSAALYANAAFIQANAAFNAANSGGGGNAATTLSVTVDSFVANGNTTTFTLSITPESKSYTSVIVEGVSQLQTTYNVSSNIIIFDGVFANGSNIQVTTLSKSAGPDNLGYFNRTYTGDNTTVSFAVTSGLTNNSIIVTENGIVQQPSSDYYVNGGNVIFRSAPASSINIGIRELASTGNIAAGGASSTSIAKSVGYSLIFGG